MKLKYKIFWVEDDADWLESKKIEIEEYLSDHGFQLILEHATKGDLNEGIDYDDFDIVAVDFNLDNGKTGDAFIKDFRDRARFTEVLFYSAADIATLRKAMSDQECDGVYCSSRSDAVEALKSLIFTTIKKTQDVNNMRGLIIAETIDIETKLKDIAIAIHRATAEVEAIARAEKIINKHEKYVVDGVASMREKGLLKLLEEDCSSIHFIPEILKKLKSDSVKNKARIEKLNKVNKEVIEIRNIMAHIREEEGVLKREDRQEVITTEVCIGYRKSLLDHHENLDDIGVVVTVE